MTAGEMLGWTSRLHSILAGPVEDRSKRLEIMMADLDSKYGISQLDEAQMEQFKKKQPFVVQLYQTIQEWRESI